MVDRALDRTTVTCVLIGQNTHAREYVEYEIEESAERGNGLLGIRIHNLKDQNGRRDWFAGPTPSALRRAGARVYDWDPTQFATWVDEAYKRAWEPEPESPFKQPIRFFNS